MKNKLFWVGACAYFIADLITTFIGLSIGAIELNPLIKTFPFMVLAKIGALIFVFGVFKYIEYIGLVSNNKKTEEFIKKFITGELLVLGVGIGIINNIVVIRSYI